MPMIPKPLLEARSKYNLWIVSALILSAMYFCTSSVVKKMDRLELEGQEERKLAEKFITQSQQNDKAMIERISQLEVQQRVLKDKQEDYAHSIQDLKRVIDKAYAAKAKDKD